MSRKTNCPPPKKNLKSSIFHSIQILQHSANWRSCIINYREKGGQFRQKEDIQKIYSFQTEDYARLEPYIKIAPVEIAESTDKESIAQVDEKPKPRPAPDGIGPTYAKRIVKYRNSLGGFHAINQLSEVYGLADSTFQSIRPQLKTTSKNTPIWTGKEPKQ